MKRRMLSLLVTVCMALSLLPVAALGADLIPLDAPTDLMWGTTDGGNKQIPMAMCWRIPATNQGRYRVDIYRKGKDAPVASAYPYCLPSEQWGSSNYFVEMDETMDSGTYYFTVKSLADNRVYSDSPIATSQEIEYTKPAARVSAPTAPVWDWPTGTASKPANDAGIGGYMFDFFYSENENEEEEFRNIIGSTIQWRTGEVRGWLEDNWLEENGTGYYWFKVRALTNDITKALNSPWTDFSPAYFLDLDSVKSRLEAILYDTSLDADGTRAAVQALDFNELTLALLSDPEAAETMAYLEEYVLDGASVTVDTTNAPAGLPRDGVSILGAGLNDVADNVKLTVAAASKSDLAVPPTLTHNTMNIRFSMALTGVQDPENLQVPVLMTLPVPDGVNPDFLHIVHYFADGTYQVLKDRELKIFQKDGKAFVSFVLGSFSDFALVVADPDQSGSDQPEPTVKPLTKAMFTVDEANVRYTGAALTKAVVGKDGEKVLVPNTDYKVEYKDNINVGTATLAIVGMGDYSGTLTYTFKIDPKPVKIILAEVANKTYDGTTDATVTSVLFDSALTEDDYVATATFRVATVGRHEEVTVTVTLKNSNYTLVEKTYQTRATIERAAMKPQAMTVVMRKTEGYSRTLDLTAGMFKFPEEKVEFMFYYRGDESYRGIEKPTLEGNILTLTAKACDDYTQINDYAWIAATSENYTSPLTVNVLYTDKIPLTLSGLTLADKTYDGKPLTYTGTLKIVETDDPSKDVTAAVLAAEDGVEYRWCEVKDGVADISDPMEEPPVDAGDYALVVTANTEEYTGILELPFTISKAAVTVTAENKSVKVNAAEPAYTVRTTGFVGQDGWRTEPTASCPTADLSKAGTYPIIPSGGTLKAGVNENNYEITYQDGVLTVSAGSSGGSGGGGSSSSGGGGGSSSSSSGSSGTNAVSVPFQPDHGKVTLNTNSAKKGDAVTITVVPDKGYQLDKLTVTDKNGKELTLKELEGGKFSFTMPDGKVEVKASFAAEEEKTETPAPTQPVTDRFKDIKPTSWYKDAVQYVYDRGMMTGMTAEDFGPEASTSRGMLVTILYRLEKEPETGKADFGDVPGTAYYASPVAWAAEKELVTGYGDGSFRPDGEITREQLVTILYRYVKLKGYDITKGEKSVAFQDSTAIKGYAREAVEWAAGVGLINGYQDGSFRPDGSATRAEVAAMLMRLCRDVAGLED